MQFSHPRLRIWVVFFGLLFPACSSVLALDLQPYKAVYKTSVNGIPSGIKVHSSLQPLEHHENTWKMSFNTNSWVIDFAEVSQFKWRGCHAQTQQYDFFFTGLGLNREASTSIDWANNTASSIANNLPVKEYPVTPLTTDPLAFSMMARCVLEKGQTENFSFHVADNNNVYYYRFRVVGAEEIQTGLGKIKAIKIERIYNKTMPKTRFWIAPDLDYFMVKFEHVENIAVRGGLILHSLNSGVIDDAYK